MDKDIWRQSANAWLQIGDDQAAETRAVSALRASEQFMLCNMRLWWNADTSHGPCARALVRNGFIAANLTQTAHESFEQFMTILAATGQPRPAFNATTRGNVSEDEALMLNVLSLCQEGHNGHAIMILKRWLPPTAYRVTLKNMIAFAGLAAVEGLVLPVRVKVSNDTHARQQPGPRYLLH